MRDADKQYLADHYYDFLKLALKILGNEEDARDAVQEAFARTMALPWVNDVHRYCIQVLRNQCWDRLRERYTIAEPSERLVDEEPNWQYERRIELLRKIKGQMPADIVAMLDLHYGKGLTVSETAAVTGHSETWVKKKISKTLRQLRQSILYEESKL